MNYRKVTTITVDVFTKSHTDCVNTLLNGILQYKASFLIKDLKMLFFFSFFVILSSLASLTQLTTDLNFKCHWHRLKFGNGLLLFFRHLDLLTRSLASYSLTEFFFVVVFTPRSNVFNLNLSCHHLSHLRLPSITSSKILSLTPTPTLPRPPTRARTHARASHAHDGRWTDDDSSSTASPPWPLPVPRFCRVRLVFCSCSFRVARDICIRGPRLLIHARPGQPFHSSGAEAGRAYARVERRWVV